MRFIKEYWPEIIAFGIIAAAIMIDLSPDLTWMHVDSDGPEYVMDAKYFYPAHHTSAPLYLLMGHLFLLLPWGTDYWKMSLMSGVFTMATVLMIYFTVRQLMKNRWYARRYAILAGFMFGAAALVLAQATVVETYAVVTFFSVTAYYCTLRNKWYLASSMMGLGVLTHHLMLLTWLVLIIAHSELRNWKRVATMAACGIFYLYMPLSIAYTDQPNMWGNTTFRDFFTNNTAVFNMLVGRLAIYDFPKRLLDTLGVLGISLGIALIPIGRWLWKKAAWKNELLWLFLLPIAYYASDLAPQVAKYMEASIAWGAIIAVLAISQIKAKHLVYSGMAISAILLLIVNTLVFDIGRTLDPNLSATKFYREELPKIPDGQIFITMAAWEWIEVYLYNKETGHKIIPVCVGTLASEEYQGRLRKQSVFVESLMEDVQPGTGKSSSHDLNRKQVEVAMSIIRNNPNVWVSRPTTPETYGAEIIPAKGNEYQITRWLGESEVIPQWQWKPSNPYDIISGAIEQTEWVFILQSNKNMMFIFQLAVGMFIFMWLAGKMVKSVRAKKVGLSDGRL